MQKNMMWLCVLGILVLAIGLAQAADVEQGDGTKNGGDDPCELDCGEDRTDSESHGPDSIGGEPCAVPMGEDSRGPFLHDLAPLVDCHQEGGNPEFVYTDLYDPNGNGTIIGYNIRDLENGDANMELCIGETNTLIQWVSLRAWRPNLVARIFKFRIDPEKDGNVWIGIDDRPEFRISTAHVRIQTADDLNAAIVDALVVRGYRVDDESQANFILVTYPPYLGISPLDVDINQISLRTSDSALTEFRIALVEDPEEPGVVCNDVVAE